MPDKTQEAVTRINSFNNSPSLCAWRNNLKAVASAALLTAGLASGTIGGALALGNHALVGGLLQHGLNAAALAGAGTQAVTVCARGAVFFGGLGFGGAAVMADRLGLSSPSWA